MNKKYLISMLLSLSASFAYAEGYDHTVVYSAATGTRARVEFRLLKGEPGTGTLTVQSDPQTKAYTEPVTYTVEWGTMAKSGAGDTIDITLADKTKYIIACALTNAACGSDETTFKRAGVSVAAPAMWARRVEK